MSSIRGTSVIGRALFKIEKTRIWPIALSTCIGALAIFFGYNNFIFRSPELGGGISNVDPLTVRSSFIVKPLSAITKAGGSRRSRNPDSRVMCWSDRCSVTPCFWKETDDTTWCNSDKEFNSVMFFIVRPKESLNFKISLTVNKYPTVVYCAMQVWVMSKGHFSNCLLWWPKYESLQFTSKKLDPGVDDLESSTITDVKQVCK